jgi:hypothetical protein
MILRKCAAAVFDGAANVARNLQIFLKGRLLSPDPLVGDGISRQVHLEVMG